ncbi:MAG: substrate-binding domain-containing protein [Desulfobacterales bacterium]|jgi:ABC-type molybdate transport system substrate-binding protein|nr:substrate-binding domain-containing protein [Desulfobacterales bacterium]
MGKKKIPVIPSDRADDLHHLEIADEADLVLFMAGNQFMVMKEIILAFKNKYPDIEKIFYETLPPGLELKQILTGGAFFRDNIIQVQADVYSSVNENAMKTLEDAGHILQKDYHLYLHNRLALMVAKNNPTGITSVADLGKDWIRISQPDPANEDIAYHIIDMYREAGGDELVHRIMEKKRAEGTTILTVVHHRETPLRIIKQTVDAGPVWATEAAYAKASGLSIEVVEPGEDLDQRERIKYYICKLKHAPHPENAGRFIDFITSPAAGRIYEKYGFTVPRK